MYTYTGKVTHTRVRGQWAVHAQFTTHLCVFLRALIGQPYPPRSIFHSPSLLSFLSLSLSHSLFPLGFFYTPFSILLGCDRRVFIAMCPWNSDNDRLTFPALSNSAAPVTAAAPFRSDWRLSIFCFCFFFFHGFLSLLRQHYTQPLPVPLVSLFLLPTLIYNLLYTSVGTSHLNKILTFITKEN